MSQFKMELNWLLLIIKHLYIMKTNDLARLFTIIGILFLFANVTFGQDLNSQDFVSKIQGPFQQIYNIVWIVCGLVLAGSVISAGYKLYNHDNRVRLEIILLFVFGAIVLFAPKLANWLAGTTILN